MMHARRGAMLLEVMVAIALLAVTVSLCIKTLTAMGRQQLALGQRAYAAELANNLLERLRGHDWPAITPALAADLKLPADAAARLPAPQLDIEITPRKSPEAKQMTVIIRWQAGAGQTVRPVRLTTWVYRKGGPRP
jgi:type II secretory pathway pseudopilin PulG